MKNLKFEPNHVQVYTLASRRETEKDVVWPNSCIYNVLSLTDRKQCFSLSALSCIESYRQAVAGTP